MQKRCIVWRIRQILIHDKKISNLKDMLPILEPAVQTGRPLLIMRMLTPSSDHPGVESPAFRS